VRTISPDAEEKMIEVIASCEEQGNTVGGIFTVVARNVPVGLGSHTQWDEKLDGRIAMSLMSVQAIKGVEFGAGFEFGRKRGSELLDEIYHSSEKGFYRKTNNAGGIEGGISNGEDIVVSCAMKPIPSLKKPLHSVDMKTKKEDLAEAVRSDVCAVPAAGVIGEGVLAFEIARAMKEKFGGDSIAEMQRNFASYMEYVKKF
jgi:chorismate synthase